MATWRELLEAEAAAHGDIVPQETLLSTWFDVEADKTPREVLEDGRLNWGSDRRRYRPLQGSHRCRFISWEKMSFGDDCSRTEVEEIANGAIASITSALIHFGWREGWSSVLAEVAYNESRKQEEDVREAISREIAADIEDAQEFERLAEENLNGEATDQPASL